MPQRQGRDVEQQHVLGGFGASAENVRLYGCAERHNFVGIKIRVRLALEEFL